MAEEDPTAENLMEYLPGVITGKIPDKQFADKNDEQANNKNGRCRRKGRCTTYQKPHHPQPHKEKKHALHLGKFTVIYEPDDWVPGYINPTYIVFNDETYPIKGFYECSQKIKELLQKKFPNLKRYKLLLDASSGVTFYGGWDSLLGSSERSDGVFYPEDVLSDTCFFHMKQNLIGGTTAEFKLLTFRNTLAFEWKKMQKLYSESRASFRFESIKWNEVYFIKRWFNLPPILFDMILGWILERSTGEPVIKSGCIGWDATQKTLQQNTYY